MIGQPQPRDRKGKKAMNSPLTIAPTVLPKSEVFSIIPSPVINSAPRGGAGIGQKKTGPQKQVQRCRRSHGKIEKGSDEQGSPNEFTTRRHQCSGGERF